MLEVAVYNTEGKQIETLKVDEARFGGEVNVALLKQAVVAYHTNSHQGSAKTKDRGTTEGSTRKLFKQKGTGNARRGNIRTNVMKGGGMAFAKEPHRVRLTLSKKMRKAALNSAILAKIQGSDLVVVDGLKFEAPKTKTFAAVLGKLGINRSCLFTLPENDEVMWRSARNVARVAVKPLAEINAYDVASRQKMLVTRGVMETLLQGGR